MKNSAVCSLNLNPRTLPMNRVRFSGPRREPSFAHTVAATFMEGAMKPVKNPDPTGAPSKTLGSVFVDTYVQELEKAREAAALKMQNKNNNNGLLDKVKSLFNFMLKFLSKLFGRFFK